MAIPDGENTVNSGGEENAGQADSRLLIGLKPAVPGGVRRKGRWGRRSQGMCFS